MIELRGNRFTYRCAYKQTHTHPHPYTHTEVQILNMYPYRKTRTAVSAQHVLQQLLTRTRRRDKQRCLRSCRYTKRYAPRPLDNYIIGYCTDAHTRREEGQNPVHFTRSSVSSKAFKGI